MPPSPRRTLTCLPLSKGFYWSGSFEPSKVLGGFGFFPLTQVTTWSAYTDRMLVTNNLTAVPDMSWLSNDDVGMIVSTLKSSGMKGGMYKYRTGAVDYADYTASNSTMEVAAPTLFIGGDYDAVRFFLVSQGVPDFFTPPFFAPAKDLRNITIVEDSGHWVQQEKPDETNAIMLAFLQSL